MTRVLRVGGVEEPFNLPWLRAFETGAFRHIDLEVIFTHFDGGTGALVGALDEGSIDLATLLTEGAVTAIANGSGCRLHSAFTTSALRWGIHVKADATQKKVAELKGKKFAISRHGSGSELMAYVLAEQHDWKLKDKQFVVVGGLDGAVEAIPKRKAHIFLWERFVTAPLVRKKVFKRIGEIASPWPAFYTAARPGLLDTDRDLIDKVVSIVLNEAALLKADEAGTIGQIMNRYGMTKRDATTWLEGVEWPETAAIDDDVLFTTMQKMVEVGRIETRVPVADLY